MSNWFKPLRGKAKIRELVTFDIEGGGGYSGFVCGSIVSDSLYSFYTDREEMFERLLSLAREGAWVFSHNLQYDLPLLEGYSFPRGNLLFTRNSILWAEYPRWGRMVRFYDSTNLFPKLSVEYLGDMVSLPKVELPLGLLRRLSGGEEWELYTPEEQALIHNRVLRDAEILFLAVANLQELILKLGGNLRPTIAGCAMDIYQRKYHKWPWKALGPNTNKLARPAYYGGRVENFVFGKVDHCQMYDVNSLYPYAQSIAKFPHPNHLQLLFPGPTDFTWMEWEGVVKGEIHVPETYMPMVPYRYDKKLFFPTGRIKAVWTIYDLRLAVAYGASIKKIEWVLASPVTFNPFVAFVEELYGMRLEYLKAGSPQANLLKLILNSLYGRWGLNEEGGLYQIASLEGKIDWDKFRGFETKDINGSLFAFGPIENTRPPAYVNVTFAAQITSVARGILNEELARQGENSIYCDTDSIITTGNIPTGNQLGDWRTQMVDGQADLLGPKEYALHNSVMGDKYIVKGIPESAAQAYFQEGAARFYRALSIREAINSCMEPTAWVETWKTAQPAIPKRQPVLPDSEAQPEFYRSLPFAAQDLHWIGGIENRVVPPPRVYPKRVFPAKRRFPRPPTLKEVQ